MNNLEIIALKSNLLNNYKYIETKNQIIERIQKLHLNDLKFKSDSEMLVLVCNLIEHLITKKDGISKIDLALDIYKHLFAISTDEEEVIKNNIKFINSNKMIKKVSYYKLFITGINELFFKKKS
jgi:cobalamin-dependent methionine synthase I